MNRKSHANQSRLGRTIASAVFGGLIVAALAGCHVDPVDSSTGGGSVAAAPKAPPTGASNSGAIKPSNTTPNTAPSTNNAQSASCRTFPGGGFVWKKNAERDGKLVVLLPSSYPVSAGVAMADRTGKVIERVNNGPRSNGNRPTFRFSRPGSSYPSPGILIVGGSTKYCIPDTNRSYR